MNAQPHPSIEQIGIVIPAHNEAAHITACLHAIARAVAQLQRLSPQVVVQTLVVLDSCTDTTEQAVNSLGVASLSCELRCVGAVRDLGVRQLIAQGATWLACTDADSQVTADWLIAQLAHQPTDMICGVVMVDDWSGLSAATKTQYLAHYQDCMGHRHIHGANLSFSAAAYQAAGGFPALPCHEDVALVEQFKTHHLAITWSNQVRVVTSSRLQARADEGFAHFLNHLQHQQA